MLTETIYVTRPSEIREPIFIEYVEILHSFIDFSRTIEKIEFDQLRYLHGKGPQNQFVSLNHYVRMCYT